MDSCVAATSTTTDILTFAGCDVLVVTGASGGEEGIVGCAGRARVGLEGFGAVAAALAAVVVAVREPFLAAAGASRGFVVLVLAAADATWPAEAGAEAGAGAALRDRNGRGIGELSVAAGRVGRKVDSNRMKL